MFGALARSRTLRLFFAYLVGVSVPLVPLLFLPFESPLVTLTFVAFLVGSLPVFLVMVVLFSLMQNQIHNDLRRAAWYLPLVAALIFLFFAFVFQGAEPVGFLVEPGNWLLFAAAYVCAVIAALTYLALTRFAEH